MGMGFSVAAAISGLMGLYAFWLPATPPHINRREFAPLVALRSLRDARKWLPPVFLVVIVNVGYAYLAAAWKTVTWWEEGNRWLEVFHGAGNLSVVTISSLGSGLGLLLLLRAYSLHTTNRSLILGGCSLVVSCVVLLFPLSAASIVFSYFFHGAGMALCYASLLILCWERSPQSLRTSAISILGISYFVGMTAGNQVNAILYERSMGPIRAYSVELVLTGCALLQIAVVLVFPYVFPNGRPPSSSARPMENASSP